MAGQMTMTVEIKELEEGAGYTARITFGGSLPSSEEVFDWTFADDRNYVRPNKKEMFQLIMEQVAEHFYPVEHGHIENYLEYASTKKSSCCDK